MPNGGKGSLGKGSNTTSTQSSTTPNPQAAALYQQILQNAQGVAATPYQAYTGQLTAPVNAQQQLGIGNINANAGAAQPYLTQAAGLAGKAAQPIGAAQIQQYQSPYTQQVIDATQAQFNNQNAQQQQQLTGNEIAQGALGGNRAGVAQGILGGQQQLAQAPVIAGLYNQGYNQAVSTAENQQQAGLAGAYGLSNIGSALQNTGLSGANAQIGAGTLEQQTQQATDIANYGQYAQQQAYPFQTQQWLAGIGAGIGPGLGSSSTGTTTGPPPNQTAQWLGAGLAGAGLLLSDRDAKEAIHKIGSTNDGQPLYRYRYKGSDQWHIGPMAQEVEKRHPEAVHQGVGGFKYVDLKAATDDSVHKAHGGPVAGLAVGGTPWSFAQGWVPTFGGVGGIAPSRGSFPSLQNPQTPNIDWSKVGNMTANPNGVFASNPAYGGDNMLTGTYGGSSSNPLPGLDASDYGVGFARGGGVAGYADGGSPDDPFGDDNRQAAYDILRGGVADDPFGDANRQAAYQLLRDNQGIRAPSTIPGGEAAPGVSNEPYRLAGTEAMDAWRAGNPVPPLGTAPVAQNDDDEGLPPEITGRASGADTGDDGVGLCWRTVKNINAVHDQSGGGLLGTDHDAPGR